MEEYEYALICEDSIDGILSGIYEAYQITEEEQIDSNDRIHLLTEEPYIQRLSCYYQHIETDRGKAEKVIRTLKKEFGESGFYDLCLAMVSWRKQGLCKYEDLLAQLDRCIEKE